MTLAVCVRCGNSKVGAFTPCTGCGLDPAAHGTERDLQARSLLLTERYLPGGELEEIGRKIRKGEPVAYDAGLLAQITEDLRTKKLPIVSKSSPGCSVALWTVVSVLLVLAVGFLLMSRLRGP
ncbi:hypothetical protein [Myxococcus xanthus]|uniref:Uncharacterized protein n=1 Tax=Myxococcus xanthus TaxID=34 RepID=A0A7Y4IKJ0_MYXXA|nr:hypothetical protein [Myxococcus xanthus]NOJ80988.1 hypothetical protein [Myxococcus xanthus]NOJ88389.1 hypothetical protein [Myxococcus xanthus]